MFIKKSSGGIKKASHPGGGMLQIQTIRGDRPNQLRDVPYSKSRVEREIEINTPWDKGRHFLQGK